ASLSSRSAGRIRRSPVVPVVPVVGTAGGPLDADTDHAVRSARTGGTRIAPGVQQHLGEAMGADVSNVRLHTGPQAAELNDRVQASAFTLGNDVFFRDGLPDTSTPSGMHLLAHEVAHTVQQGASAVRRRSGKKKTAPSGPTAPVNPGPAVAGHLGLSRVATDAFAVAKPLNADYVESEKQVEAWVTQDQQKKIADVAGHSKRSKGDADKRSLKDLLRAFVMAEYTDIVETKLAKPQTDTGDYAQPTTEERKRLDTRYFPKTLQNGDKWAGLISKGPYAPETQTWLRSAGFDAAIPRTDTQLATDAKGPRIDVRATFIGGEILGAPRRMHLFIVYTSTDGDQFYFRGGPDEDDFTVCDFGAYEPDTIDWDPAAPSVSVAKGDKAKSGFDGLQEGANHIDGLKVPYVAAEPNLNKGGLGGLEAFVSGENCNSVAWTLLKRAGVSTKKPSGLHPGWGHNLGDLKKQGAQALPPPEATTGGTAALVKGAATDAVQVYTDRSLIEKVCTLPGGTTVQDLLHTNKAAKITFGPKAAVGWVEVAKVGPVPRPSRPFWVKAEKDRMIAFADGSGNFADGWKPIEVLDPTFVVGGKGPVDVRYTAFGQTYEGTLDAQYLTDTDPAKAVPVDKDRDKDKDKGGVKPVAPKDKGPFVAPKGPVKPEPENKPESGHAPITTDLTLPLYLEDGSQDPRKGIQGGRKRQVTPTGRTADSDKGVMVEFTVDDPKATAWMPMSTWTRLFNTKYPT
ncbi:MAG: DUF4157 domain-containing protein, partial [Candidatus Limnocylindrales bacterium]